MFRKDRSVLPPGIQVIFDGRQSEGGEMGQDGEEASSSLQTPAAAAPKRKRAKYAATGTGGVQGLDISYSPLHLHLQKSETILEEAGNSLACGICSDVLSSNEAVVCSHAFCDHTAHLTCLSSKFLDDEEKGKRGSNILPVQGTCPGCHGQLNWGDLVRELSLRTRAKPKEKRGRKETVPKHVAHAASPADGSESSNDEDEAEISALDIADIPEGKEAEAEEASRMLLDEAWHLGSLDDGANGFGGCNVDIVDMTDM